MSSKAKSGMSAVRQYTESIRQLTPPNTFVAGATSFTGPIRDGKGHSAFHAAVTNDTIGTIQILMAWRATGPFVKVFERAAALDPVSGLFTVDIICPIVRRFIQAVFNAPAPGLGANFELGAYFEPRSDSNFLEIAGGVPVPPPVMVSSSITGVVQTQTVETIAPLGAGASKVGVSHDCINFESYGISVFVIAGVGALNVTVLVENSVNGATWRPTDSVTLSGAAGATGVLNRVYSVTREFYRVTVTNNDGVNALATTEMISILKPI